MKQHLPVQTIDHLFESATKGYRSRIIGVIEGSVQVARMVQAGLL
jgi:hypothetical protein